MLSLTSERLDAVVDPFGATLRALQFRRRTGRIMETVVTGPGMRYGGATIGRYANRIAGASFELDGRTFELTPNEGVNQLHGGPVGLSNVRWSAQEVRPESAALTYCSPDGDQGFPGELSVQVRYSLDGAALRIDYDASCSADTVINLTNHSYFDLMGGAGPCTDHVLQIHASRYTPVDDDLIPTGEIAPVDGTRFDFRTPKRVAVVYDTNWALDGDAGLLRPAALLADAAGTCTLEIRTTEPGLQVYSGNAKGLALETQHFPDSPHHPQFPSTVLRAGGAFRSTTIYRFND